MVDLTFSKRAQSFSEKRFSVYHLMVDLTLSKGAQSFPERRFSMYYFFIYLLNNVSKKFPISVQRGYILGMRAGFRSNPKMYIRWPNHPWQRCTEHELAEPLKLITRSTFRQVPTRRIHLSFVECAYGEYSSQYRKNNLILNAGQD